MVNHQSNLGFRGFLSFSVSLFICQSSRITFTPLGWGNTSRFLRCQKEHVPKDKNRGGGTTSRTSRCQKGHALSHKDLQKSWNQCAHLVTGISQIHGINMHLVIGISQNNRINMLNICQCWSILVNIDHYTILRT